ncbi:hypothetical protein IQ62_26535 [Streptomyces scabiei]|nr:hypothetical protein IQ62_26535 [Streptomyces scabiei]
MTAADKGLVDEGALLVPHVQQVPVIAVGEVDVPFGADAAARRQGRGRAGSGVVGETGTALRSVDLQKPHPGHGVLRRDLAVAAHLEGVTVDRSGTAGWSGNGEGLTFNGSGTCIKVPDNIMSGMNSITVSMDLQLDAAQATPAARTGPGRIGTEMASSIDVLLAETYLSIRSS